MTRPHPPSLLEHPGWEPTVRAGLEALLAGPPGLALFDCDDTLLTGDISETALADLAADRAEPLVEAYHEHVRRDTLGAYVALVHTLVAGRTEAEVRALAERTLSRHPELRLRSALHELVWKLQRRDWQVLVISASPETLVQVVVAPLGIHPHAVIGMRSLADASGRFLPELADIPTWREGKAVVAARLSSTPPALSVGDSAGDLPMMAASTRSLLIDRGAPGIREAAGLVGAWIQRAAALS